MTLQTPRRRISPQTKRRCRAIKGFFRKALGTTSQPDLHITSSIAINVTDIKHKLGVELQHADSHDYDNNVDAVSEKKNGSHEDLLYEGDEISQAEMLSRAPQAGVETKVLYKTSESHYKKSDSETEKNKNESSVFLNDDMYGYHSQSAKKRNRRNKCNNGHLTNVERNLRKHKTKSVYESFTSELSTNTFLSMNQFKEMAYLEPGDRSFDEENKNRNWGRGVHHQHKMYKEIKTTLSPDRYNHKAKEHQTKKSKPKVSYNELDYDFIADIIKKQYKAVQIGRKVSDLSQFSAPECRDRELFFNDKNDNLRRPNYDCWAYKPDYTAHCSDHSEVREFMGGRNYGHRSSRRNRKKYARDYNDSDLYDLVPVKEKSSPKSRRKCFKDNIGIHKEVLPSPRSHRPKLNLEVQYHTDLEEVLDDMVTFENPTPKRILQQQLLDKNTVLLPQPRRKEYGNDMKYVSRPFQRISPNEAKSQHYDEEMNLGPRAEARPSLCQMQQYDNEYEVRYMTSPYKRSTRRQLQQCEIEDEFDYDTMIKPRKCLPKELIQNYGNNDAYVARPRKEMSPKRSTQHCDNDMAVRRCSSRKCSSKIMTQQEDIGVIESDDQPELVHKRNNTIVADMPNAMGVCSFQCSTVMPHENTPVIKIHDAITSEDKTDKALGEIKDILQKFLRELKKESQSTNSDISNKTTMHCVPPDTTGPPNSMNSFNDYSAMQCPLAPNHLISEFANTPCCYPIIPVCPVNCIQNGFPTNNPSFPCTQCTSKHAENTANNKCNETPRTENVTKPDASGQPFKTDTNEMIKEIYKFVSQSPTIFRKKSVSAEKLNSPRNNLKPILTSRGAGGSREIYIQNAKVGTPKTNCVSKSCEAIAQTSSDVYTSETNASCSETVFDKSSLEATGTTASVTETDTTESELEKAKSTKISKALKSWSVFKKKKKKDVIEELSEEHDKGTTKSPFHQNITNYMMHGQEYFAPPPASNINYSTANYRPPDYINYGLPFNPGIPNFSMSLPTQESFCNSKTAPHDAYPCYRGPCHASTAFEGYGRIPPGPLCLQEVEVKSIGCQSEKKLSFFRKIGIRNQNQLVMPKIEAPNKACSTQTAQENGNNKPAGGMFKWAKPMNHHDTLNFNYKTEKKLAAGDIKMRKAMIKKMFYKRNPFSTNNLLIKTLLGRDRSSYGEAPSMYRPRMFL